MIDNIEDVFVKRGKKRDFVTKLSLKFKICGQYAEILLMGA